MKAAQEKAVLWICRSRLKRAASTDSNAPHKLVFPRTRVDFAAQNPFWRGVWGGGVGFFLFICFILFFSPVYFVSLDLES